MRTVTPRLSRGEFSVYGFKNFDTPPCFEQAPRWLAACEYMPSLHCAIAPVGSLSSPRLLDALVAVFGAAVALGAWDFASDFVRAGDVAGTDAGRLGAAVAVGAGAEPLMPPCFEQAPRPGLLIVPSVQVT